jgi:hypothetical protein
MSIRKPKFNGRDFQKVGCAACSVGRNAPAMDDSTTNHYEKAKKTLAKRAKSIFFGVHVSTVKYKKEKNTLFFCLFAFFAMLADFFFHSFAVAIHIMLYIQAPLLSF